MHFHVSFFIREILLASCVFLCATKCFQIWVCRYKKKIYSPDRVTLVILIKIDSTEHLAKERRKVYLMGAYMSEQMFSRNFY